MSSPAEHLSVSSRIIALLALFAEGDETMSIQDISQRLQLAPSTVHRLVNSLVEHNMVERAAHRRYCIGREFVRIGALASRKISIPRMARPMLHQVMMSTGETSLLLRLLPNGRELTIIDKIESMHPLRYRVSLHTRRDLIWGAQGRGVLAWLNADEISRVHGASGSSPITGEPPPTLADLRIDLGKIRDAGYAISHGQVVLGAVDIVAPFFDADDQVAGNLALTIPEMRYRKRDEMRLARILITEASKLSIALGSHAHTARSQP